MKRALSIAVVLSFVLVAASGCSIVPPPSSQDVALLEAAVSEFDAESMAPVVCEDSGAGGLKPYPFQSVMVRDVGSWSSIAARFEDLGYSGSSDAKRFEYERGRLTVGGIPVVRSGEDEYIERRLGELGCEIPPEGGVFLTIDVSR
jgi:hypothetical protein